MQWYRFVSIGKVQHVYYRKFVSQALMRRGYCGYIRNLPDGTVESVVFLDDEERALPEVLRILKEGSPMSEVEEVRREILTQPPETTTDGFEIRY